MSTKRRVRLALTLPLCLAVTACASAAPGTFTVDHPGEELSSTATADGTEADPAGGDGAQVTADPADDTGAGTEADPGPVARFDEAQPAVVQIIATGTLRDPEIGMTSTVGSGSGFLVSPDGYAVTNNHVVTGASALSVHVGGDTGRSYAATVVGASECSDLALIKLETAREMTYLAWSQEEAWPGLDVYAAGFPLGDPEYTLTRGIVSKAQADGDVTGSSSIERTIEHDATIQPGNSGGPLITVDGEVVAVNYAGGSLQPNASKQFWAIAADLAEPMVETLHQGDTESLGINGQPVFDEQLALSGIWVSGVKPGTPAEEAGLLPGDIILSLDGIPMATDGTYRDYCNVLRTTAGQTLTAEVLRWDSFEVLRGEVNGDQELEQILSLTEEVGDQVAEGGAPFDPDQSTTYTFETLTDDTGMLSVDVPVQWDERKTEPGHAPGGWAFIGASDDLEAFQFGLDHPGLLFYLLPYQGQIQDILHFYGYESYCAQEQTQEFTDAMYTGAFQVWSECGDSDGIIVVLVASDHDDTFTAVMTTYAETEADLEALDRAFASFTVRVD